MRRNLYILVCSMLILGTAARVHAQAAAAGAKDRSLQLGGGFTIASPDYTDRNITGITIYGDYDFISRFGLDFGVEGDIHYLTLSEPRQIGEKTYEIGPRAVVRRRFFDVYGKLLFGAGTFADSNPSSDTYNTNYSYLMYSFGGGVDLHVLPYLNVRIADLEYQSWRNFAKVGPNNGLTPLLFTFGVAYNFR